MMNTINKSWWINPPLTLEEETEDVLRRYILEPQIPIHDPKLHFHPRTPDIPSLYHIPACPAITKIIPERCAKSGKIIDWIETLIENAGSTARNSMSLTREPGASEETTRGNAMNFPFWPGGFDEPEKNFQDLKVEDFNFEQDLQSCPPGFSNGMAFKDCREDNSQGGVVDLLSVIERDDVELWDEIGENKITLPQTRMGEQETEKLNLKTDVDESLLKVSETFDSVLKISNVGNKKENMAEWAEMLDVAKPVKDFYIRVPELAHTYPFELDIFQKQAIIKLEEHNHVFVAAHTSAGKTVVAEYAIALSKKHMTKTIYTSPIKALSNQKYRDFKQIFNDVGLITGDIQIDPTSSCLIMTTEILRSMLYCGSDITRDLEYVIFDEVHYITDADRGHVWEEVLILLPDHVCIVMLSATVPNTLEFANWLGKTKQKKVYVVSTVKRPVPLKHYLYTGCGSKSKDDIFLIVDENSQFKVGGYDKAKEAKLARMSKNVNKNPQGKGPFNQKQEQTLWVGLIDHLKRNDKLPVVAFTLSRNRCDSNAEALMSCDLTTSREKYHVNQFFQRCLQKLKPPDRVLPQVIQIQNCLQRGIGIHHSGILPILKEIVEMLFQNGVVKILFATETFAMGVNMPARTVIFDSTNKFDGVRSRMLQPAEYTQMAGRAGRRGLDENGTVIIICKGDIPPEDQLKLMILGKPMRLESQFRLTYAMILYLLRVEMVTVENMMSHSFREFGNQMKIPENKTELKKMEDTISSLNQLSDHLKPLCDFYNIAYDYIQLWNELQPLSLTQQKIANELKPGKILIISHAYHYNKVAILLSVSQQIRKDSTYKVLVLDNQNNGEAKDGLERGELWHQMLGLSAQYRIFIPEGVNGHSVLTVKTQEIIEISKRTIKIDASKILQNWDTRQIPRFKNSPPSQVVIDAIAQLQELNNSILNESVTLEFLKSSQNIHMLEQNNKIKQLKEELKAIEAYTDIPNFIQEFAVVFDRMQLEKKLKDLKFKVSPESMSLYPDYQNKLNVLEELKYIDQMHQVAMKGRVACEMGQNELMITELVLRNILTDLEPAEIAALLSSLVFQAKTDVTPNMTETLKKAEKLFKEVEVDISKVEAKFDVTKNDEMQAKDKLNFGLVEVVYEWARNKPFAEIMKLTDIKEGIIVRCIQQLNETLCNVKDAARIIGDPVLHSKMEEASNAIKRDIVFAASLYTTGDNLNFEME